MKKLVKKGAKKGELKELDMKEDGTKQDMK